MPKLIDHAAREVEVAEAAWRVVVRDGVRALSVRNVAAEAGLATGSLRRAFPTQVALMAFSLELVRRRTAARIAEVAAAEVPLVERAEQMLSQMIPLDEERRTEMEVFLVIGSLALTEPGLRPVYDDTYEQMSAGCRSILGRLAGEGFVRGGLDLDLEGRRLHAVVDGLALHLVRQAEGQPTGWASQVLATHLGSLV